MTIRRRDLFVVGGIIALIYGVRALPWDRLGGREVSYVDIEGVPEVHRELCRVDVPTTAAVAAARVAGLEVQAFLQR